MVNGGVLNCLWKTLHSSAPKSSCLAMIHKTVMLSSYYDRLHDIQLFSLYTSRTGGHFLIFVFHEDFDKRNPAESGISFISS